MKGATADTAAMIADTFDFNPRTREGCDDLQLLGVLITHDISIHAPVKGAT